MRDVTSHGKDLKFMKLSGSRSEIKEFMETDEALHKDGQESNKSAA